MAKLVIVESPAKAKTIGKYLGDDYEVTASMGHIRDLPASQLGIDVEHGYAPQYISIKGKEKLIKELKSKAKHSDGVLLATDPDREVKPSAGIWPTSWASTPTSPTASPSMRSPRRACRRVWPTPAPLTRTCSMHSRPAVCWTVWWATSSAPSCGASPPGPFGGPRAERGRPPHRRPRKGDRELQARRILECGCHPRRRPQELYRPAGLPMPRARSCCPKAKPRARAIEKGLEGAEYVVAELKKGKRAKQPTPAFITSTLQQEASRRLGFTATRTMRAAQTLYEGVDIAGHGTMGLITYMRTDSLRISDEAGGCRQRSISQGPTAKTISAPTSAHGRPRAPLPHRMPTRPSVPRCRP